MFRQAPSLDIAKADQMCKTWMAILKAKTIVYQMGRDIAFSMFDDDFSITVRKRMSRCSCRCLLSVASGSCKHTACRLALA